MRTFVATIAISGLGLAFASPAAASESATSGMRISLTVPEVCEISAQTIALQDTDGVTTGSIYEMCNSGQAFRIVASHRELAADEDVVVTYADETSNLQQSGISNIADRSGPSARAIPITITRSNLTGPLTISLGIVAI